MVVILAEMTSQRLFILEQSFISIQVNGLPSMQLSHELGARPNPSSSYTATKFGLLRDMLHILYSTPSVVAADLSNELKIINVAICVTVKKTYPRCGHSRYSEAGAI